MASMLIVDDEKITRDSLKDFVPWDELGVDRVEIAANGASALEMAEKLLPDIVLTDVRMPKMDGIELAEKLRSLQPDCKLLFISGYSDKEYLKSAIHLKAIRYIEKPLSIDELKDAVGEAVAQMREERKARSDIESIKSRMRGSLPLIRQEIAVSLVNPGADAEALAARYGEPFRALQADGVYEVYCAAFNWAPGAGPCELNEERRKILECLAGPGAALPAPCAAGFIEGSRLALVVPADQCRGQGAAARLLGALAEPARGRYTVSVGLGPESAGLGGVPAAYRAASAAVEMQFYDGPGRVFEGLRPGARFTLNRTQIAAFRECLRFDRLDEAARLAEGFAKAALAARDADIGRVKNAYLRLLLDVFAAARERNLIGFEEADEQRNLWQELERVRFLSDLSGYLKHSVEAIGPKARQGDGAGRKVAEIKKFIRDNVADSRLCTQSIARSAYLSQTYLCSYFKKATGTTLNDYVTEVRMERARELLTDPRVKLYEVASRIGLMDPNYFSTLFKKHTGCTPSEYREKCAR